MPHPNLHRVVINAVAPNGTVYRRVSTTASRTRAPEQVIEWAERKHGRLLLRQCEDNHEFNPIIRVDLS